MYERSYSLGNERHVLKRRLEHNKEGVYGSDIVDAFPDLSDSRIIVYTIESSDGLGLPM